MTSEANTIDAIEFLTGVRPSLPIRGRYVWGRSPYRDQTGMLYVEVTSTDPAIVSDAMKCIGLAEMALSQPERNRIFRAACVSNSRRVNEETVAKNGMKLLVSSNGHITAVAKAALELLGY